MKKSILLGLGLLSCVAFNSIFSQTAYDAVHFSENELGTGPKALGMGCAFTGVADDHSAIYWNPAGLGQITDQTLYSSLSHVRLNNETVYNQSITSPVRDYTRFGSFGYIYPVQTTRGALVFGFGYNRINNYDGHMQFSGMDSLSNDIGFDISINDSVSTYYPFDINTLRSEESTTRGGVHAWTAGGAVMLSPNFTLGFSTVFVRGSEDYRLHYDQYDINDVYQDYPGDFNSYSVTNLLQSKVSSIVFKIGGLFSLGQNFSLGGTITLPSTWGIDEIHSTEDLLIFDDGYEDATENSGQFKYHIKTPFVFDGGLAFLSSALTLSASARYRDWSQIQFVIDRNDYDDADYRSFLYENEVIRNNYQPTVEYRFGGELTLMKSLHLRAGYLLIPSPLITNDNEFQREYYTGGVGLILDQNVTLDAALISGNWKKLSADSYTPEGTLETITNNKLVVGISYRF